jgi:hypothetical protein
VALVQVAGLASVWEGQTVVATEPLGGDLTAALLAAGARAVIARRPDQPDPSAQHAVAFFQELYEHLLAGRTLVEVQTPCHRQWQVAALESQQNAVAENECFVCILLHLSMSHPQALTLAERQCAPLAGAYECVFASQ